MHPWQLRAFHTCQLCQPWGSMAEIVYKQIYAHKNPHIRCVCFFCCVSKFAADIGSCLMLPIMQQIIVPCILAPNRQNISNKSGTCVRQDISNKRLPTDKTSTSRRRLMDVSSTSRRRLIDVSSTSHRRRIDISSTSHRRLVDVSSTSCRRLVDVSSTSRLRLVDVSSTSRRRIVD